MIYLKTILEVPGLAPMSHIAELEVIDSRTCRPLRMLELHDATVAGAFRRTPALSHNFTAPPQDLIPHPDHWGDIDLAHERVEQSEFEALWLEAEQKFGF